MGMRMRQWLKSEPMYDIVSQHIYFVIYDGDNYLDIQFQISMLSQEFLSFPNSVCSHFPPYDYKMSTFESEMLPEN